MDWRYNPHSLLFMNAFSVQLTDDTQTVSSTITPLLCIVWYPDAVMPADLTFVSVFSLSMSSVLSVFVTMNLASMPLLEADIMAESGEVVANVSNDAPMSICSVYTLVLALSMRYMSALNVLSGDM